MPSMLLSIIPPLKDLSHQPALAIISPYETVVPTITFIRPPLLHGTSMLELIHHLVCELDPEGSGAAENW